jgi:serine/threonine protein kinase
VALPPGSRLGPYEIVSLLGAGGMGEVYKARDTRLDREVAVKVVTAELSASSDQRQRFEREARTISKLPRCEPSRIHPRPRAKRSLSKSSPRISMSKWLHGPARR